MSNELTVLNPQQVAVIERPPMTSQQLIAQVKLIQDVMSAVMKEGLDQHYAVIPGTKKKSLLKPGAEKLQMVFHLRPEFKIDPKDLPGGHKEFMIVCTMRDSSGASLGEGVGFASTMESKWRYRTGQKSLTDRIVPQRYWELRKTDPKAAQDLIGGPGHGTAKKDNVWFVTEGGDDNRVENENIADCYNTVIKMGKKRAQVDAVLTCTAASDIFTQDAEELPSAEQESPPQENVKARATRSYKEDKSPAVDPPDELPLDASRQPIDADGDFFWNGPIKDVTKHPGKNANGEEYVLSKIHMENGDYATTFNEALANDAEYIKGTEGIRVIWEPNKRRKGTFTYLGFKEMPLAETP